MKPPEGVKVELLPMDDTDRARNEVRAKVTIDGQAVCTRPGCLRPLSEHEYGMFCP